ncbi:MAG: hypothetical protein K6G73_06275 [Marinilabiliaceae bacterium]|nr:hypothetical protein [Marinilabiliaceae bacterium]
MNNATIYKAICTLTILLFAACTSVNELVTFSKCDFSFNSVNDVRIADIDVSRLRSYADLSAVDAIKLVSALSTGKLNLELTVNVKAHNKNQTQASLSGFDYILWIDDAQMLEGSMEQHFEIGPGKAINMPMHFAIDLWSVLKSESRDKILNFGFGLATNNADVSRVKISLKPYFRVGDSITKLPYYVTIGGDKIMPRK